MSLPEEEIGALNGLSPLRSSRNLSVEGRLARGVVSCNVPVDRG